MTTPPPAPTPPAKPLPGHETQSAEMSCPACGRFVGAATKCPYCGSKVAKRMSLVALRWAAVLLSTVGLVLLWLMAKTREPARIRIGDIETTMNFGLVRLSGEVKYDPRPFKNGNGMSFNVGDGSGTIVVFVDQTQRKRMVADGLVPKKGDRIDFVAQLQAASSGNSARIRSLEPGSFSLVRGGEPVGAGAPARAAAGRRGRGAAAVAAVAAVADAALGSFATVEGALRDPVDLGGKGTAFTLADASGSVQVVFWTNTVPAELALEAGAAARVRVNGRVKEYRGTRQLVPATARGLQILD